MRKWHSKRLKVRNKTGWVGFYFWLAKSDFVFVIESTSWTEGTAQNSKRKGSTFSLYLCEIFMAPAKGTNPHRLVDP